MVSNSVVVENSVASGIFSQMLRQSKHDKNMRYRIRLFFTTSLTLYCLFATLTHAQSYAQSPDLLAPTILLSPGEYTEIAGQLKGEEVFEVTINDNGIISRVLLYYRFGEQIEFSSKEMRLAVENSNIYVAKVKFKDQDISKIEYYIDAEDSSGNFSLKGQSFNPMVRTIQTPSRPAINENPAAEPTVARNRENNTIKKKGSNTVFYVLGAVLLGVIAASVSDDGGGGGESASCNSLGCPVDFTIPPAQ